MCVSAGEPAEEDLPAGGAAAQWDAAEGWVGAEMQVWNRTFIHALKTAIYIVKDANYLAS